MKRNLVFIITIFMNCLVNSQPAPELYSWIRNLTGATGYNGIETNVQSVDYNSTEVYVSATCIPGYSIGPWNGNPNTPVNQNFVYAITRSPKKNNGTPTVTGLGHIGVWSNGVSIFNAKDGMSYNNQGIWNRDAYFWEGLSFDYCLGHPAPNGEYHHHVNPKCLYNANDNSRHSPIIGYAFDGFPIYGAYGYTNTNGTGAIKRMASSYVLNSGNTRSNGPAVSTTYPLGCFIEDYSYVSGSGDLDGHNGRFCVTPEYPNGIYAYFVTINSSLNPVYPYTLGPSYYGTVTPGNTGPGSGHNNIPGGATTYNDSFTPEIIIETAQTSICSGTSVTFTTDVENEGSNPMYSWKKNNVTVGTGNSYTSSTLQNNDQLKCVLTSNAYYLTSNTSTSNTILMKVNAPVTPEVDISSSNTEVCEGTGIDFIADGLNEGNAPEYQWKLNGIDIPGANGYNYTSSDLADGDVISCEMTSNAACADPLTVLSNPIALTIIPKVIPSLNIVTDTTGICEGTTVLFNSSALNGGTTPFFKWKLNGNDIPGVTSGTYTTDSLQQGDIIRCTLTSNAQCANPVNVSSNNIIMEVHPVVAAKVEIMSNGNNLCQGDTAIFIAAVVNGGQNPQYQWQINGMDVNGAKLGNWETASLVNGDKVSCSMLSNEVCANPSSTESNAIDMVINAKLIPAISIDISKNPVEPGDTIIFTATSLNQGSIPIYQWKKNGINTGINYPVYTDYELVDGDKLSCEMTSSEECVTNPLAISDTITVEMKTTGTVAPGIEEVSIKLNNPFTDYIIVRPDTDIEAASVTLYDVKGVMVKTWNSITIKSKSGTSFIVGDSIPPGSYLLEIENNRQRLVNLLIHY